MPLGYSEEFWNSMGYTEYDPVRQTMRRVFPTSAAPCGQVALEAAPEAGDPDGSVAVAPTGGLPWRDERKPHDAAGMVQVNAGGGRYYRGADGRRYPSITTVLDRMGDRSALDAWRARVGEEEAERVRAVSSRIGDAVHAQMSELAAHGTVAMERGEGDEAEAIRAHVARLRRAVEGNVTAIYATEMPIKSDVLGAAGTVDLVCEWDGKLAIVDFKTKSRPMHPLSLDRYYVQAGFYAICWKEMFGSTPNRLVVLESTMNADDAVVHTDTLFPHIIRPLSGETDGFMRALAAAKEECKKW